MKKNILIPGVALALGLGVGFGVGKGGGGADDAALAAEKEMRTRVSDRSSVRDGDATNRRKERSLDEIYQRPGQSNRIQGLLDYYANLSPDEFQGEAEKLESLPFNERILAAVLLFGKWAEIDPTAAMSFTDSMGMAGGFVRPTVLQGWASTDPVNAAKYYEENPAQFAMMNMMGGRGGRGGMSGPAGIIAGEWAKQDPEGAMKWASNLQSNSDEAMTSVVSEVAKIDPAKAAKMIGSMDESARAGAYESVAEQWGAKNFSEAQIWANGLPEGERGAALAAAIKGLAQTSPELAVTEFGKMTDKEARLEAIPTVAKNLARNDLKGSITMIKGLDDAGERERSMREVMPIWASGDSAAALDFIKSEPSPSVKDSAAQTYVWSNRDSSPAELAEVAGMISDDRNRSRTTGIVAARWMQEDKEGATNFINNSDAINDRMKERLLDGRGMWGGRGGGGRGRGGRGR